MTALATPLSAPRLQINGKFPAWKKDVDEGYFNSPREALKASGKNYKTLACPMEAILPDGTRMAVDDRALVRGVMPNDPTRRFIATVGPNYGPIQHSEFAAMLTPISDAYPLVMIGSTGKYDEKIFFGFDLGEWYPGGMESEATRNYLYAWSANDGESSIGLMRTRVRMACLNMYHSARKAATLFVRIRHNNQTWRNAQQWVKLVEQLNRNELAEREQIERTIAAKIVRSEIETIIDAAFPLPKTPRIVTMAEATGAEEMPDQVNERRRAWQREIERMQEYRVSAVQIYDRLCDEFPRIASTPYAAVQAVAELQTWRNGRGAQDAILFGDRAQSTERAFEAALAFSR